ncbi:MAG: twin-arginine translocase TatA/TatE family subunit [Bacillati bacterium ANGP1]|uniref:Twin-arginine translocase TatA/TatE family subunit n=1 Tax=Candidatus Segetimicrobium genomatis TaxID=2569760 RepID=A0A537JFK3_9BACT|nr:MAG: twin-arginine translocase TatA/TatE family subunit [Terrabacteria group bacterium ANGP1]
MFENEFKLLVLLTIALLIFGPSKMASLGGTIGKSIRDFRNAVRGAQESFREQMADLKESVKEADPAATDPAVPPALPAPDPAAPGGFPATAESSAGVPAAEPLHRQVPVDPSEHEERDSLASEPSAQAVQELIQRKE